MGIKERKQRYKEEFRLKILDAAKKLFVSEGIEATSLRKIAKEIEFSPTTIYLYYKDKNDLVYALHREGFSLLRNQMAPLMHVEDPFERLKAIGRVYLNFARQESDFYEVIFMKKEPMEYLDSSCNVVEWEEGDRVFDFLLTTIEDCQRLGYFKGMKKETAALQAWSVTHGMASLMITGHLKKIGKIEESSLYEDEFMNMIFLAYLNMLEHLK